MRTMIWTAFFAGALASVLACADANAGPQGLVGSWNGIGMQVTATGKQEEWTITMTLRADGLGRIEYPSLSCGGTLAIVGDQVYRETITHGTCVSGGTVRLRQAPGGKLIWGWTAEGTNFSDVNASAMLFPAGANS